jgi:hypothetical protein
MERAWKEVIVVYFKALSLNLPLLTENIRKRHTGQPVPGPSFKPGTSRLRSQSDNPSSIISTSEHRLNLSTRFPVAEDNLY